MHRPVIRKIIRLLFVFWAFANSTIYGIRDLEYKPVDDKLSGELAQYLICPEIVNFDSNLNYAPVRALIQYYLNHILEDTSRRTTDLKKQLCSAYLRAYVINIHNLFQKQIKYSTMLAKLENNIFIRVDNNTMDKVFVIRKKILLAYLIHIRPNFRKLDNRMQDLVVGLFIPAQRDQSVQTLLSDMLENIRWLLDASTEDREQFAILRQEQSALVGDLIKVTAPLSAEDGQ